MSCLHTHLSLGLSEQAAKSLVSQGPVGELGALPGLLLLQPQLELPQSAQLLHQLPLTCPAGLEIQLQVQGGTSGLLSQGGAVRLLLTRKYIRNWIFNTCETNLRLSKRLYLFISQCSSFQSVPDKRGFLRQSRAVTVTAVQLKDKIEDKFTKDRNIKGELLTHFENTKRKT